MRKAPRKAQLHCALDPTLKAELDTLARQRRVPQGAVVEAAVHQLLHPEAHPPADLQGLLLRRLDALAGGQEQVVQYLVLVMEAVTTFVRLYLSLTPRPAPDQASAAQQLGAERYHKYLDYMAQRLLAGKSLLTDLPPEVLLAPDVAEGAPDAS